LSLSW